MNANLCVYCAASDAVDRAYQEAAGELGAEMARRGFDLVYGGGKVGLMGAVARAVLAGGGRVTGVIPEALRDLELAFEDAHEMIVTRTMHERKAAMSERADAFVALPGGFGTFEEILEIIAHRQLGYHRKPAVILNVRGYYDPLLRQFERSFSERFTGEEHRLNYEVAATPAEALELIERSLAPGAETIA